MKKFRKMKHSNLEEKNRRRISYTELLSVTQELRQADLDRLWNPLLFIDNILSESKEATWLTATINHKGEAYVMERRRVRGIFMENLELDDFPLDVQVQLQFFISIFHCKLKIFIYDFSHLSNILFTSTAK